MNPRLQIIAVGIALGLVAGGESGCTQKEPPPCACAPEKQLDEALMLVLASARAYHHQADLFLEQGEVDQAVAALEALLKSDLDPRWPEAEEARLDAVARLALLHLGQGQVEKALSLVEKNLAQAPRESFFLSNLHGVRGEILERQAKELKEKGDDAAARQRARDAIQAFETSIDINKRLQSRLLSRRKK